MGFLLALIFLIGWIYQGQKTKKLRSELINKQYEIVKLSNNKNKAVLNDNITTADAPILLQGESVVEIKPCEIKAQTEQDRIEDMERTIRRLESKSNSKFQRWFNENSRPVLVDGNFQIEYSDFEGVISERVITPKEICYQPQQKAYYILAFCHSRQEDRTFRSDNIISARNLETNREIKELGKYLLKTQY